MSRAKNNLVRAFVAALLFSAKSAFACAVCAGNSDSDLARGMNWGIFTLLGVVVCVLGGIATFFIYLIRKSSAHAAAVTTQTLSQTTSQI